MWNRASRRGKGYMEDQDALSWRGKRGSYSSPRNHNCCPSSLQGCSTKRINLREARTYQGEHHGCPQVGQVLTKNFRAAISGDKHLHLTYLDIIGPKPRPSISYLSPDFVWPSTGQQKEQCRKKRSSS